MRQRPPLAELFQYASTGHTNPIVRLRPGTRRPRQFPGSADTPAIFAMSVPFRPPACCNRSMKCMTGFACAVLMIFRGPIFSIDGEPVRTAWRAPRPRGFIVSGPMPWKKGRAFRRLGARFPGETVSGFSTEFNSAPKSRQVVGIFCRDSLKTPCSPPKSGPSDEIHVGILAPHIRQARRKSTCNRNRILMQMRTTPHPETYPPPAPCRSDRR